MNIVVTAITCIGGMAMLFNPKKGTVMYKLSRFLLFGGIFGMLVLKIFSLKS